MLLAPALFLVALQQPNPASAWTDQTFDGRVTVSCPVKLVKVAIDSKTVHPESWRTITPSCTYTVSILTFSEGADSKDRDANYSLTGFAHGSVKGEDSIVGERDLLVQGWQGYAMTAVVKSGALGILHTFFCGDSLVCCACAIMPGQKRPPEVDRFLDSIRFATQGPQTELGPTLTRRDLSDSAASALCPGVPLRQEIPAAPGTGKPPSVIYMCEYIGRRFFVLCRPGLSKPSSEFGDVERSTALSLSTNSIMELFGMKKGKQKGFILGKDTGLWTELTGPDHDKGSCVVFLHGTLLIALWEVGPHSFDTPANTDAFLRSVEFKQ